MDSRIGLDYIVENKDYTTKLAAGVLGTTIILFTVHTDFLQYFDWSEITIHINGATPKKESD